MPKQIIFTRVKVISASYGPAEGRRLLDGSIVDHSKSGLYLPYTRDVTRFFNNDVHEDDLSFQEDLCQNVIRSSYSLIEGRPMNVVFGDPCPGSTKVLQIKYVFQDYIRKENENSCKGDPGYYITPSRTFHSTFAEHEQILLRRQDPHPLLLLEEEDQKDKNRLTNPQSTSFVDFTQSTMSASNSEIILPLMFPFLSVTERARCQLVCLHWREIVLSRGITSSIDINDHVLFPLFQDSSSAKDTAIGSPLKPQSMSQSNSISHTTTPNASAIHPHRVLLCGLLKSSHSSLTSLVLNDFLHLNPPVDIHPTLPHLGKLKRLDISRIPLITNDTIHLISAHVGERLEVLYIKGVRGVSDDGIVQLVKSCNRLKVLDISHMHQLTDKSGVAIGQNLSELETFHARDNYKMTNNSVDVIFQNCDKLVQATFWGCIKVTRVGPGINSDELASNLVLLNLWGCIGLTDDCVARLGNLTNLRSLCVSECHKLTDSFVLEITQTIPQLLHLQMRYLKRITDESLNAISLRMSKLFSLDLSFCTKLSIGGLSKLLLDCRSLSELRLYSCTQLNVEGQVTNGDGNNRIGGGRQLVQALRHSTLAFLDLRRCQKHEPSSRDTHFLNAMKDLGYNEVMAYLFIKMTDPAVAVN